MHPGRRHGALRLHPGPLVRRLLQRGHQQVAVSAGRCGGPNPALCIRSRCLPAIPSPPRPIGPPPAPASLGRSPSPRAGGVTYPAQRRPGLRRTWEGRGRRNREAHGTVRGGGLWLPAEGDACSRSLGWRISARALKLRAGLLPGGKPCGEQPRVGLRHFRNSGQPGTPGRHRPGETVKLPA